MREHLLIYALFIFARCIIASADPGYVCLAWASDQQSLREQTVYFEPGRAALNVEAKRKVAEVANYLKVNPSAALIIEGHCDDRGKEEHNRRLGDRRAQVARKELVRAGVDPARVDFISYGKDRQTDPGHDGEARRKNRRAEFVVLTPPK
jgi:outer membrane protein OmpA-like peptidoglycan-associated protein